MSILSTTKSGIKSMQLTPEIAVALGWKIEADTERPEITDWNGKHPSHRTISMMRKDGIWAPITLHYEPIGVFKNCWYDFHFPGDKEIYSIGLERKSSRTRMIKTVSELMDCFEITKMGNNYSQKIQKLWQKTASKLEDPKAEYYTND